jgi:hypothetical protein
MAKTDLTAQRLREVFHYEPQTGVFTRLQNSYRNTALAGPITGYLRKNGHLAIRVDNKLFFAHQLAWLYMFGDWPSGQIDHIDGNPANNVFSNLRDSDKRLNAENLRKAHKDCASGLLGAYKHRNKWSSRIMVNGKNVYLGTHETPELAHAAYLVAKRAFHQGCTI